MRRAATAAFVLAFVAVSSVAWAQLPADTSLAVGGRLWVSGGYSTNSLVRSELRWRGVDSVVPELNVDYMWRRLVVLGSVGGGKIDQGVFIDEDFAAGSDHRDRIGRTRSDVNDTGLVYVNADVGWRLLRWGPSERPGFVDALVGYQYWFERYVAFGVTGVATDPAIGTSLPPSVKAITQEYTWHSLRLGGRTEIPLFGGLSANVRAFALPWSKHILNDIHHQRSEASFREEVDGGLGVQADGGLTYRIWRGLSVEAGYQYWWVKSGEGTRILENKTERHGPYFGVKYRF
jgi:opacity protein-like surface antigen